MLKSSSSSNNINSTKTSSLIGSIILNGEERDGFYGLFCTILTYLDVVALVEKKTVCRKWKHACAEAIQQKCFQRQIFLDRFELKRAIQRYTKYNRTDMETFAKTYGYPIGKWDVSLVTDFSYLFAWSCFNETIDEWNVSLVTDMKGMFYYTPAFNQPLANWNVTNVRDMKYMFSHSTQFNQPLGTWDVSNVKNMKYMFQNATNFNQNIADWNVAKVREMKCMFDHATVFNQNLKQWDVRNVRDMGFMFRNAQEFHHDLSTWITVSCSNMGGMFENAKEFHDFHYTMRDYFQYDDIVLLCKYCNATRCVCWKNII